MTIPREVCMRMGLRPGFKLQVFAYKGRIELIPIRPMREMQGFLEGFDPTFQREEIDREIGPA